jgi:hypothetical protein
MFECIEPTRGLFFLALLGLFTFVLFANSHHLHPRGASRTFQYMRECNPVLAVSVQKHAFKSTFRTGRTDSYCSTALVRKSDCQVR